MKKIYLWGVLIPLWIFSGIAFAHDEKAAAVPPDPGAFYGEQLGTVMLPFSCSEEAGGGAVRGLALLHHMTYAGARAAFETTARIDPDCVLGYWGQAMSYIHPLWSDPPGGDDFEKGKSLAAVAEARAKTDHERAYAGAVKAYYAAGRNPTEAANLEAFARGWQRVYETYPQDMEAASFYALAYLATASPADKSYAKQKVSADIAAKVLARIPDHPGAHHYTIHALDYPPLAAQALEVARSYGKIAPEVPHALHMPAHIFTRLGLWQESIDMNRRSADAALKHPVNGQISLHYLHALDYLVYAYLQRGEDAKARAVFDELTALKGPYQPHVASAYTFAAVPARMALERQQWATAATLKARTPTDYPWQINPAMEAITAFANGLGAAHLGDRAAAQTAIAHLSAFEKQTAKISAYWAGQVAIQRVAVQAWLAYMEGKKEEALKTMIEAAAMEAATEKHPVTPGEVLPAHELLADMYFEMGRYGDAITNYRTALERSPNRFNSLYGAGRAAEQVGDREQATRYYRQLVEVAATDSGLPRLQHARAFLGGK